MSTTPATSPSNGNAPRLEENDFPSLYLLADTTSKSGRDRTFWQTRLYLGALTAGALAGAVTWTVGTHDAMGWIAVAAFLISVALTLTLGLCKPDRAWYQGRAAAESVKSLTWCYVTGAEPFPAGDAEAEGKFVDRLRQIVTELSEFDTPAQNGQQITPQMRRLRESSFSMRRRAYVAGRIEDQTEWYATKSRFHRARRRQLLWGAGLSALAGLIFGLLRALGVMQVDLLGVFAAIGAAFVAESQLRQHAINASAYALAVQELGMVSALAESADEASWPRIVAEAEEAISREHTMWCARSGVIIGNND